MQEMSYILKVAQSMVAAAPGMASTVEKDGDAAVCADGMRSRRHVLMFLAGRREHGDGKA